MAITKETVIAAIEVVGQYKHVQVATDTVIKEDDTEISKILLIINLAPYCMSLLK